MKLDTFGDKECILFFNKPNFALWRPFIPWKVSFIHVKNEGIFVIFDNLEMFLKITLKCIATELYHISDKENSLLYWIYNMNGNLKEKKYIFFIKMSR